MKEKGVSGILITSGYNNLEGILTRRDLRFVTDYNKFVSEVMTPKSDLIVAPANITLNEAKTILDEHKIEKLPLVSHGKLTGLITASDINKKDLHKNATKDEKGKLRVGAAIGVKTDAISRAHALLEVGVDTLVVDIAHGHSDLAINTVKNLRKEFGDNIDICAGNVATTGGTEDLISAGVDSVKVGIGPGSICVTRIVAGAGVPQLTAIMDCAEAAKNNNIPIIADGGRRTSGDIVKALAAGASNVMIGNLFAGSTESPGSPIIRNGRRYKIIRGMASLGASLGRESREKKGSFDKDDMDDYASSVVPEGVEAMVPFRGSVKEIITQLVGGLRSGISYCGSLSISEMQKRAEFIHISVAGIKESNALDVESV